jgi:hypothetical protein
MGQIGGRGRTERDELGRAANHAKSPSHNVRCRWNRSPRRALSFPELPRMYWQVWKHPGSRQTRQRGVSL